MPLRSAARTSTLCTTAAILSGLLSATQLGAQAAPPTPQELRRGLLTPPAEARPMVRWWWFGAAVTQPEILRELQQMKADGIGGAELAFVYPEVLDDPAHGLTNLPFLSPEMLRAVQYAQQQGRLLGLRIDVTLCSGWPYGGPHIALADAATRLRVVEVHLSAGGSSAPTPSLQEGETLLSAAVVKGNPKAEPDPWQASTAQSLQLSASSVATPPAAYPRTVLFFVQSHTRQQVKRAAVGAEGYVLDPFSREAVAKHLKAVGEPLVNAFGTTPPYAIFSDSLEAYGADWTPNLPAEFRKRRGYDLMEHLPELVAGGSPAAEKVRHDYGRTLKELVDENYLTQIDEWATAHGTKFRSQTYGDPAVSFSSQSLVALAEGEGPQWRAFSTLRWASSANHVFDNPVTSGETFTWLHSPVFRATPLDMKAEADVDFIMGENQLIFHGWPYSPSADKLPTGDPGWSLYAAAVFNDHNPWHPVMPAVTGYIARISYLLRQGQPANQVAILLPTDDAWAAFSPGKVSVTDAMKNLISTDLMSAILTAGYNVDYIDADAIEKVGLGSHQILILPPTDRLPAATLLKIAAFAKAGGKVICEGRTPSLDATGAPASGNSIAQVPGSVSVASVVELPAALHAAATPDLTLSNTDAAREQIGFLRRKLPTADIYFVVNTSNRSMQIKATFASKYTSGQEFNPETGVPYPQAISRSEHELQLAPYESRVFIFSESGSHEPTAAKTSLRLLQDLSSGWTVNFPSLHRSLAEPTRTDWTSDPATLHYSGEAIYTRTVEIASLPSTPVLLEIEGGTALPGAPNTPAEHVLDSDALPNPLITKPGPGMHAFFDPPLHEAALVTVNGRAAGALWHPPYRLDVSGLLQAGSNTIEVRVYNTALNAWSALGPHDYKPLIQKYGDRFQMQDLDKVKPIPSGLLGPIHLVSQEPE